MQDRPNDREQIIRYYDAEAPGYQQQYDPDLLYDNHEYPANYFRLQLILKRLKEVGARNVLDVGCGDAIPMIAMLREGLEVTGLDISEGMLDQARNNLERAGLGGSKVHLLDFEDSPALKRMVGEMKYDAVVAAGVFPHSSDEALFVQSAREALRGGGRLFLEFRNKLFSLFTMNRYTRQFILDDLLAGVDIELRGIVEEELDRRLATDQPPARLKGAGVDTPGYDAITAKFHNPLELPEQISKHGFECATIHWYHFHPALPFLESRAPRLFREEAVRLERPSDWRGHFLCSAGVIEAIAK